MGYSPFEIGTIVTNNEMCSAYKIGNMGGMRKSNTHNCLVLISDHTKGLYDDKWYGDELHYTGMGQEGDQVLKGNQNGTLFYSNTNGVEVHLFEVIDRGEYIYCGEVKLTGEPYQETQLDRNDNPRKVWMFPIRPISGDSVYTEEHLNKLRERRRSQAERMSLDDLEKVAKIHSNARPSIRKVSSKQIVRDEFISTYTKKRANGVCQLCNHPAPFSDKSGNPYLESHHIVWLSNGGEDTVKNSVALCPNCHKKMHIVNSPEDVAILIQKNEDI